MLVADHQTEQNADEVEFCHCVGEGDSESVARIEQALRAPLRSGGVDFTDVRLGEVVNTLSTDYGIPIHLDDVALNDIGLNPEEPITANYNNISLRSALRLMLKKKNLTSIIRDEVLLITSPEEAEKNLVTCVYNVQGLMDETDSESTDSLVDTITSCIATESWSENGGGQATLRPLAPGLLVITQTRAVQEDVRGLLTTIRKMREQAPGRRGHHREPEPAQNDASSKTSQRSRAAEGVGLF